MRTKKAAALAYAALGMRVFPCAWMLLKDCSCERADCHSPAKHPRIKGWQDAATTDPQAITAWWDQWPEANIGIVTGEKSGVWVLDLDGPEGVAALAEIEERRGQLPKTVTSQTGSVGQHRFFRWDSARPVTNRVKLAGKKIDTRGNGGYVVAPPSNHKSGNDYEWIHAPGETEVASAPDWLMEFVRCEEGPARNSHQHSDDQFQDLVQSLDLTTDEGAPEGQRHARATKLVASALGKGISVPRVTAYALEWGQRCNPPMDSEEVLQIIEWGARKEGEKLEDSGIAPAREWPVRREGALYGLAGEIVRFVEPETEADPMAVQVQFLAAFGTMIGRGAHFMVGPTAHYCNLFAVIVGDTAKGRKGTSADLVKAALEEASLGVKLPRVVGGMVSGEGLIYHVRDALPKAEQTGGKGASKQPQAQDTLGVTDKRLLILESEFGAVLNVMRREGNTLSPVVRMAWDSKPLGTLAKNSPNQATGAHVSIIGHITQAELLKSLHDVEGYNGFGNRFLWVCARRARLLPNGGANLDLSRFQARLAECIDFASSAKRLTRDAEAEAYWDDLYRRYAQPQPGFFGIMAARSESQVLRLSMIYALLDKSTVIRRPHLEAADALWQYCEDSARYIFGNSTGDAQADTLLEEIRQRPRSMRDLHKALSGHCSASQLRATLQRLATQRLIECRKESTGGRPAEIWHPVT